MSSYTYSRSSNLHCIDILHCTLLRFISISVGRSVYLLQLSIFILCLQMFTNYLILYIITSYTPHQVILHWIDILKHSPTHFVIVADKGNSSNNGTPHMHIYSDFSKYQRKIIRLYCPIILASI